VIVVASAWDEGALADRIRRSGVGCVTLVVRAGGAAIAPRAQDVHVVDAAAIESGDTLAF
jgi:hypothetical protein